MRPPRRWRRRAGRSLAGPSGHAPGRRPGLRRKATFVEFCRNLGVTLEPGQEVVARVAIDGEPVTTQLGFEIFGFWGPPPPEVRDIFVAVCGIRSGKSRIFGALHALYLACTADTRGLADGEELWCAFVAPAEDTARLTYNYVKGQVEAHPWLSRRVIGKIGADSFLFRSKHGHPIRFCVVAASAGGRTLRGPYHLGTFLEEAAYFQGSDKVVNDEDIFTAVSERVWPKGGRLCVGSSPWAKDGLLWDLYRTNHPSEGGQPTTCLVAHAPTRLMRSDPKVLERMAKRRLAREKAGELEIWFKEYDAKFLSLGSTLHFDPDTLRLCADLDEGDCAPEASRPGDMLVASCDLAMVRDRASLTIGRLRTVMVDRKRDDGTTERVAARRCDIVFVKERAPEQGKPLVPSEVCDEFAADMRAYGVTVAMADIHYREVLREATRRAGIRLRDAPTDTSLPYVKTKAKMREGLVGLPPGVGGALLRAQFEKVRKRTLAGGGMTIVLPRPRPGKEGTAGGHCDAAASAVLTVFQSVGAEVPAPEMTPDERLEAQVEASIRLTEASVLGRKGRRRIAP